MEPEGLFVGAKCSTPPNDETTTMVGTYLVIWRTVSKPCSRLCINLTPSWHQWFDLSHDEETSAHRTSTDGDLDRKNLALAES
jgi:hypothetical protein